MSQVILLEELDEVSGGLLKKKVNCIKVTVRSGDTLPSLATRYNTTVKVLRDLNRMWPNMELRAGQELWVPQVAVDL